MYRMHDMRDVEAILYMEIVEVLVIVWSFPGCVHSAFILLFLPQKRLYKWEIQAKSNDEVLHSSDMGIRVV